MRQQCFGVLHRINAHLEHRILGAVEFLLHMNVRGAKHDMNQRILRKLYALIYGIDIALHRACKRSNGDAIAYGSGDFLNRLKIPCRRRGKTSLDNIDVQPL